MKKKSGKKKRVSSKQKFNIKKTWQFKTLIFLIMFLVILIILYFFVYEPVIEDKELEGELGTIGIFGEFEETGVVRANCSYENLRVMWDYIFQESSDSIIDITDVGADEMCNYSLSYKILGDNTAYIMWCAYGNSNSLAMAATYSFYGNFTDSFMTTLQEVTPSFLKSFYDDYLRYVDDGNRRYVQGYRDISNIDEANNEYHSVFKIENGSWELPDSFYGDYYRFYDEIDVDELAFEERDYIYERASKIFQNKTIDYLEYVGAVIKPLNLTQIKDIEDIMIDKSSIRGHTLYLGNYFQNIGIGYPNLSISYSFSKNIQTNVSDFFGNVFFDTSDVLNESFIMNISLSHPSWNSGANVTSNNFNVTVIGCLDSDGGNDYYKKGSTQNLTLNGTDYCVDNYTVKEYYCSNQNLEEFSATVAGYYCEDGALVINTSVEHAPRFLSDDCDDLEWEANTNYEIDMKDCWVDDDGDSLSGYRYENASNDNLTIILNSTNLTLIPDTDWIGSGYFKIFVSDGKNESEGRVDFTVRVPPNIIHLPSQQTPLQQSRVFQLTLK